MCKILFAVLLSSVGLAQSQVSPEVEAAIKLGLAGKPADLFATCDVGATFGQNFAGGLNRNAGRTYSRPYHVELATNIGMIALEAARAKKEFRPFGPTDVTPEMLKPAVYLSLTPSEPTQTKDTNVLNLAPSLTHVVLKSRSKGEAVVQPVKLDIIPVKWSLGGGQWAGTRATATFDIEAVRALPNGDFDIVLVTEGGNRACKVSKDKRAKLKF